MVKGVTAAAAFRKTPFNETQNSYMYESCSKYYMMVDKILRNNLH